MSDYEELVERCAHKVTHHHADTSEGFARLVLAEVLRTLETMTPEMWDALPPRALDFDEAYLAMLRASPLAPPK